jgi:hypothetical protein
MQTLRPPVVSIQAGFTLLETRHGGIFSSASRTQFFKPRHQQVRIARGHPSMHALNQLAPQLDQLRDTA